jgi:hypothetical protein
VTTGLILIEATSVGLSAGAIGGIVGGSIAGLIVISVIIGLVIRQKRRNDAEKGPDSQRESQHEMKDRAQPVGTWCFEDEGGSEPPGARLRDDQLDQHDHEEYSARLRP